MENLLHNNIYLGDCLDVMKDITDNSIDLILCDLPYGTTACKWDSVIPLDKLWASYNRICKPNAAMVFTASQPFTTSLIWSNLSKFKYCWVWDKKKPSNFPLAKIQPMKYHEDIAVFCNGKVPYFPIMVPVEGRKAKKGKNDGAAVFHKGLERADYLDKVYTDKYPSSILEFSNADQTNRLHPTQKPVGLCEYLIKTYTKEGDLVLDNCAGSGSTLVAAKNLKRSYIGIEKDENYYKICLNRLKDASKNDSDSNIKT